MLLLKTKPGDAGNGSAALAKSRLQALIAPRNTPVDPEELYRQIAEDIVSVLRRYSFQLCGAAS